MKPVRLILILSLALFLMTLSGCKGTKSLASTKYQTRYLPAVVADLYLGMPMKAAIAAHPGMKFDSDDDFRKSYIETFDSDGLSNITYYFDDNAEGSLYEFIIEYDNAEERDAVAAKYLGKPNYEDNTEWLYDSREGFNIHAWNYNSKLVIVGVIKGTEWSEE
ncbi:MAG: hypothetical protein R3D00_08345 [Bacteroidia bacterium]